MLYGSAMASFAVEKFSLDGLHSLRGEHIDQRFDALMGMMRI